jgi:hypothetical protein
MCVGERLRVGEHVQAKQVFIFYSVEVRMFS